MDQSPDENCPPPTDNLSASLLPPTGWILEDLLTFSGGAVNLHCFSSSALVLRCDVNPVGGLREEPCQYHSCLRA